MSLGSKELELADRVDAFVAEHGFLPGRVVVPSAFMKALRSELGGRIRYVVPTGNSSKPGIALHGITVLEGPEWEM